MLGLVVSLMLMLTRLEDAVFTVCCQMNVQFPLSVSFIPIYMTLVERLHTSLKHIE